MCSGLCSGRGLGAELIHAVWLSAHGKGEGSMNGERNYSFCSVPLAGILLFFAIITKLYLSLRKRCYCVVGRTIEYYRN